MSSSGVASVDIDESQSSLLSSKSKKEARSLSSGCRSARAANTYMSEVVKGSPSLRAVFFVCFSLLSYDLNRFLYSSPLAFSVFRLTRFDRRVAAISDSCSFGSLLFRFRAGWVLLSIVARVCEGAGTS